MAYGDFARKQVLRKTIIASSSEELDKKVNDFRSVNKCVAETTFFHEKVGFVSSVFFEV